ERVHDIDLSRHFRARSRLSTSRGSSRGAFDTLKLAYSCGICVATGENARCGKERREVVREQAEYIRGQLGTRQGDLPLQRTFCLQDLSLDLVHLLTRGFVLCLPGGLSASKGIVDHDQRFRDCLEFQRKAANAGASRSSSRYR